jgi:asparagine synthase (glutamine-hydrolysing)
MHQGRVFNGVRDCTMCGIAGYLSTRWVDQSVLHAMVDALVHRGPDSRGFFHDRAYHAGMRRLSINDVAGGDQPLYNESRDVVVLYNGEIYNYPQVRAGLEQRGHRFQTRSDGEVICHLYEECGEALFERLDAMYAAALWDVKKQRLVLARDIPGEKPLYYARLSAKELAFASELKSIIRFPYVSTELDRQALWDFPTFLWVPEPDTVYASVKALERGHMLITDSDGIRIRGIRNTFGPIELPATDDDRIALTHETITAAVKSRLLSDVPVGCFLSSGLDSSIVAAIARQNLPHLHTFTIGFEDIDDPYHGRADESAAATHFAAAIGSTHQVVRVTAADFRRDLRTMAVFGDQPFSVSSGLGILAIARAARDADIKVLLSGDGADECFGGYSWYPLIPQTLGGPVAETSSDQTISCQHTTLDPAAITSHLRRYTPATRAWAWHYYASESDKARLYADDITHPARSSLRWFEAFKQGDTWSSEDFIRQDRGFYFPFEMLRKVDRMTMAFSVEGRVPFAAPAVLALADLLPYAAMVREGSLKWALRRAFAGLLPGRGCAPAQARIQRARRPLAQRSLVGPD